MDVCKSQLEKPEEAPHGHDKRLDGVHLVKSPFAGKRCGLSDLVTLKHGALK